MQLHSLVLCLLHQSSDDLCPFLVEQRFADLHAIDHLLEREGHATPDDHFIHLVEQVVNQLNFVLDFRTTKDGQVRTCRSLQHAREGSEFLAEEESGGTGVELHADHAAMGPVRGAEGIVDEHIAQLRETGTEGRHGRLVRLDLLAVGALGRPFLLDVETKVLQQDHAALRRSSARTLHLRTDAFGQEGHLASEFLLEHRHDGLE
jgi:hypothetical protein